MLVSAVRFYITIRSMNATNDVCIIRHSQFPVSTYAVVLTIHSFDEQSKGGYSHSDCQEIEHGLDVLKADHIGGSPSVQTLRRREQPFLGQTIQEAVLGKVQHTVETEINMMLVVIPEVWGNKTKSDVSSLKYSQSTTVVRSISTGPSKPLS